LTVAMIMLATMQMTMTTCIQIQNGDTRASYGAHG
jgi:hypothetical protein